jgi:hypothetical protein
MRLRASTAVTAVAVTSASNGGTTKALSSAGIKFAYRD